MSQWHYLTISFSVIFFYFCLQSFPASGSFPMSQLFTLVGQSIGDSASIPQINIHCWFPLGLIGLITLLSNLLQESSPAPQFESINSLVLSHLYGPALSSLMITRKTIALTGWTFFGKVMSLLFNILPRFAIAFLPRSKGLLFGGLQWLSTVILEPRK